MIGKTEKIKRAQEMLANPDLGELNIIDIAFEAGYKTIQTFNEQFRDVTGMCPTEYRAFYMNFKLVTDMDPAEFSGAKV